uniref:DNA replication licensing factor MCM5 n=1 Tax=Glossina morsitans morsitans TaxID=37546 RepID=A0A1B0FQM5_GLOMM
MEGFDEAGVFFSDNLFGDCPQQDGNQINMQAVKKKYKEFLRTFNEDNFFYKYRDTLKRNYLNGRYFLEVELEDLAGFDESLADKLTKQPTEHLQIFEEAALEVADEITAPRPDIEEQMHDVQILLMSNAIPTNVRDLKSDCVSRLVKIAGIIVSASGIKAKATRISIMCRSCGVVIPNLKINPGLEGYMLPRKCTTEQAGRPRCPLDPFFIMPEKCRCVDFQILKLQELPDFVPQGEIPRHLQLFCDRTLCERVVPGNRVLIQGIYSIRKVGKPTRQDGREKSVVGVRAPYMRVVGITVDTEGSGAISRYSNITSEEEETFRCMAASPTLYDRLASSLAPSIFGSHDIKRAITCMLFGGSRKRLPDGLCRRGDINVLLLGDPGTAKSQLLKFVEKVAPIGIYTSGKGSSAAVLAAANSIFGRWDETKGEENIDFMPTILSRFDMIFIIKDIHDEARDITMAKHIINVHLSSNKSAPNEPAEGEISLPLFKKYIYYCRTHCGPRLSEEAGEKLKNRYVLMRNGAGQQEKSSDKRLSIPITVRQLEAIIRITESLAKMRLLPFATDEHINEALRLFQVSTLDAAMTGSLAGAEGFTTEEDQETLNRIEKQLKRRFAIGSQVSEQNIIQDFLKQKYEERTILKVIHTMIRRGELQHRMQRKMLYRLC